MRQIKLDRWPKIQNVTMSYSLLGQLYGPKRALWRCHIPYGVNFMAQNVTKNCSNTAIRSKNCSKTVKTGNVTTSHSLLGRLYGPEYTLQTAWQRQKMAFFQMAWRDAAIGLIYSGRRTKTKHSRGGQAIELETKLRRSHWLVGEPPRTTRRKRRKGLN